MDWSLPHLLGRLAAKQRTQARAELLNLNTLTRVVGAAVGGKDGGNQIEEWSDHLAEMAGVGLSEAEKASREFNRFMDVRKEEAAQKNRQDLERDSIQAKRRKAREQRG